METFLKSFKKKIILLPIGFIICMFIVSACNKAGCADCLYQKQEFCKALSDVHCNSVYLTDNIDMLTRACGSSEATSFISTTTQNCSAGTLTCPQCE